MTAIADNKKRVTIKTAKPGDRFDVQISADGTVVLKPLVTRDDDDVPLVKMVRTKEGFLMFPKGKGPSREAILAAIREDRDVYHHHRSRDGRDECHHHGLV